MKLTKSTITGFKSGNLEGAHSICHALDKKSFTLFANIFSILPDRTRNTLSNASPDCNFNPYPNKDPIPLTETYPLCYPELDSLTINYAAAYTAAILGWVIFYELVPYIVTFIPKPILISSYSNKSSS
jgi:hypothetical protein